jgi:hypothetical protein
VYSFSGTILLALGVEVVPRPSNQPVILCFFLGTNEIFFGSLIYGDDLASTGKKQLRMAFRAFRIPRDYPIALISADYDYAMAA